MYELMRFLEIILLLYVAFVIMTGAWGVTHYLVGELFRDEKFKRWGKLSLWLTMLPFSLLRTTWYDEWWKQSRMKVSFQRLRLLKAQRHTTRRESA